MAPKPGTVSYQPDTYWAWLAGFVDGDGSIGTYVNNGYPTIRLSIAQKDRLVLEEIRQDLGVGSISGTLLVLGPAATREVLRRMMPYLRVKRFRAQEALDAWSERQKV